MTPSWHIAGGRVLDPATGRDETADLFIAEGWIVDRPPRGASRPRVLQARGCLITPGFLDLHVHLREPGDEEAETIETGTRAAARGGFTTVVAMPNTRPPVDAPDRVSWVLDRARTVQAARALPCACLTVGRAGGALAPLAALRAAGAVAFSDDGSTVADAALMARAMEEAARLGVPVLDHAMDPARSGHGVMRDGAVSRRAGWPGIPADAEPRMVERDVNLVRQTGCRVHLQHLSCAASVALFRRARSEGLPVSAEATPHHLTLTEDDVERLGARAKMNPPLGTAADREALLEAVADGTIEALATDHAPHTEQAKSRGMLEAPFGVVGLETAAGVTWQALVSSGRLSLLEWVRRWTTGPAAILGLTPPSLDPGRPADLAVWDVSAEWTVRARDFLSKSRNTPFEGWRLSCRSILTLCGGKVVWKEP